MKDLKKLITTYFNTPERKAKLYLLLTIAQIWAVIAMIIGVVVFAFLLLKDMGVI